MDSNTNYKNWTGFEYGIKLRGYDFYNELDLNIKTKVQELFKNWDSGKLFLYEIFNELENLELNEILSIFLYLHSESRNFNLNYKDLIKDFKNEKMLLSSPSEKVLVNYINKIADEKTFYIKGKEKRPTIRVKQILNNNLWENWIKTLEDTKYFKCLSKKKEFIILKFNPFNDEDYPNIIFIQKVDNDNILIYSYSKKDSALKLFDKIIKIIETNNLGCKIQYLERNLIKYAETNSKDGLKSFNAKQINISEKDENFVSSINVTSNDANSLLSYGKSNNFFFESVGVLCENSPLIFAEFGINGDITYRKGNYNTFIKTIKEISEETIKKNNYNNVFTIKTNNKKLNKKEILNLLCKIYNPKGFSIHSEYWTRNELKLNQIFYLTEENEEFFEGYIIDKENNFIRNIIIEDNQISFGNYGGNYINTIDILNKLQMYILGRFDFQESKINFPEVNNNQILNLLIYYFAKNNLIDEDLVEIEDIVEKLDLKINALKIEEIKSSLIAKKLVRKKDNKFKFNLKKEAVINEIIQNLFKNNFKLSKYFKKI